METDQKYAETEILVNPSKIFDPLKPEYDLKIGETDRKKWEIPQRISLKGFPIIFFFKKTPQKILLWGDVRFRVGPFPW